MGETAVSLVLKKKKEKKIACVVAGGLFMVLYPIICANF